MQENIVDISLLSVMAYACYMPEVFLFTDTLLLPKWYLTLAAALAWIVWRVWKGASNKQNATDWNAIARHAKDVLVGASMFECGYVAFEICRHGLSAIGEAGTFDNPAGLAVCMSIAVPVAIDRMRERSKAGRVALYAFAALCFVVTIFLTKSRTGIICLALYAMTYTFVLVRGKWGVKILALIAICSALAVFIVNNKRDSTSGRLFILQNTFELIGEKPFAGHGYNGFERLYMQKQAEHFCRHENCEYSMLADEVQHPLNEFAYAWVNFGIMAPLAMMTLFLLPAIICIKKKYRLLSVLQFPVIAVFTFSLFSYPFHYPLPWCVMAADVIACACITCGANRLRNRTVRVAACLLCVVAMTGMSYDAWQEHKWKQAWKDLRHGKECAMSEYAQLSSYFSSNRYFLYNYAFALFSKGRFLDAIAAGKLCSHSWNGYNLQLLMGDAARMANDHVAALAHYRTASNMCPSRLAPLEGMYLSAQATNNKNMQRQVAERIRDHKIKVPSADAYRIKERCR